MGVRSPWDKFQFKFHFQFIGSTSFTIDKEYTTLTIILGFNRKSNYAISKSVVHSHKESVSSRRLQNVGDLLMANPI